MQLPQIGTEERAVYHLVEHGHVDAVTAGLYRDPLRRLEARGLVLRRPDGGFVCRVGEAPTAPTIPPPRMSSAPPPSDPAMVTLVVRVPVAMKEALDELGRSSDLSKATRAVIAKGLAAASGARRKVANG